ncbi:hypothetical protein K461DRAFT_280441 [Myriangium duriaei CBS 260.36]|uniref:Uncharacterized protein n=1 Tax=Myriangium duriaei CBS 260.36 TaxID=1168546 RepID=A0A9P4MEX3_9PEZI|nr:hypothetical protein K461DRAFT_280441 [Myriangium duriaei CBS 260.36]
MSSSGSTSVVSYALRALPEEATLSGSVINVGPTATTLAIKCFGGNSIMCAPRKDITYTITIGPWALPTPPSEASTGVMDLLYTIPVSPPEVVSEHCEIASTLTPKICTTTGDPLAVEPNWTPSGTSTSTVTESAQTEGWAPASVTPITITAGLEKLKGHASPGSGSVASTSSGSASATSSLSSQAAGSEATTQSASVAMTGSEASNSAIATSAPSLTFASQSTASSTTASVSTSSHSGVATRVYGVGSGTMGLIGLVAAFVIR